MKKYILAALILAGCSSKNSDQPTPEPVPTPSAPAGEVCQSLVSKPTRGLAMLHCSGEPAARANCAQLVRAMVESCIDKPAANYLVNGTFGFDAAAITADVMALTANGRKGDFTFYVLNGPGQRNSGVDTSADVHISAKDMIAKLKKGDFGLKTLYLSKLEALRPILQLIASRGGKGRVVAQLEDNMDLGAFNVLVSWTKGANLPGVVLGRNGGSGGTPAGLYTETHPCSIGAVSTRGGVITNDGCGFTFPGENASSGDISAELAKQMELKAETLGSTFIAWQAGNQGRSNIGPVPANKRPYKILDDSHVNFYKEFLRS
jgi:hypothetical protein